MSHPAHHGFLEVRAPARSRFTARARPSVVARALRARVPTISKPTTKFANTRHSPRLCFGGPGYLLPGFVPSAGRTGSDRPATETRARPSVVARAPRARVPTISKPTTKLEGRRQACLPARPHRFLSRRDKRAVAGGRASLRAVPPEYPQKRTASRRDARSLFTCVQLTPIHLC